jgi:hypothetical protein
MLGNFKLSTKFSLLLLLIFVSATLVGGWILARLLEQTAITEISDRGQVLMEAIDSVRNYTNSRINPLLAPQLETRADFIPEAIPSFAARQVFEGLRQNPEYKDFLYKDAATNPTNLSDKADKFEASLIAQFRREPQLKARSGFQDMYGKQMFYYARPLKISNAKCLRCHSTPAKAPKSHLATYGRENGFGWQLNQIVATQIIYVPANRVFDRVHQTFFWCIGVFILTFFVAILLINYLLHRHVIQPLQPIIQTAEQVSTDTSDCEQAKAIESKRLQAIAKHGDEIGHLGRVLQKTLRAVYMREDNLKQQLHQLQSELETLKKERQIAQKAQSEYLQSLRNEAQDRQNKWN